MGILSGYLLTKWQNYFSVTEMLLESMLEMFLKKVNCKKKQCGQNLPTLFLMEKYMI